MNQPVSSFVSEGNVRSSSVKQSHEYKLLKENIKKIGIKTPITYRVNDKGQNVIINGHQRFEIAKSLGLEDIPAFEMNGVDDVTAQIATNLFTVPMNHMDGAKAIIDLYNNGATPTKKELSTLFGKNNNWINISLALTNVSPLLTNYIKDSYGGFAHGCADELCKISESNVDTQEKIMFEILANEYNSSALNNYKDMNQEWFNEMVDDYGWADNKLFAFVESVADKLSDDNVRFKEICDIVGLDTFREFEKEMGVEYEYQDGLFEEYNDLQWCRDEEFLQQLFYKYTEIGTYLFENNVPVDTDVIRDNSWSNIQSFSFDNKLSTFKKNLSKQADASFARVDIVGWDGNVTNPHLVFKVLEEDKKDNKSTTETPKEPNFSLLYNKLNKVIAPVVNDYMKKSVRGQIEEQDENGMYITLKWLLNVNGRHTIRYTHVEEGDGNATLLRKCLYQWFDYNYGNADFNEIELLCNELELYSLDKVVKDEYKSNIDFRKSYLSCFPMQVLKEELPDVTGKKSEIVDKIAETSTEPIMFDYCMTNNGSGADNLDSYLPRD